MNTISAILTSSGQSMSTGTMILYAAIYIVLFGGIFYFLLIRPQKKQQKQINDLQSRLEPGDNIMTTGGFYGTVLDIVDDTVIVEFGNNKNCRIPMHKNAIAEIEKANQGDEVEEAPVETKKEKKSRKAKAEDKTETKAE